MCWLKGDAYRIGRVGPGGDEVDLVVLLLLGLLEHPLVAVIGCHFPYQPAATRNRCIITSGTAIS